MKPAILCVDDEAILTLALTRSLKAAFGAEVHIDAAGSAEEALEAIEELRASGIETKVVICDLYMPGQRGDEFLAMLSRSFPSIRSILLSGITDAAESSRIGTELGLFASLSKPVRNSELIDVVGRALRAAG